MDGQVDIWSVGVILYEALFGRAPYASGSLEVWRTSTVVGYHIFWHSNFQCCGFILPGTWNSGPVFLPNPFSYLDQGFLSSLKIWSYWIKKKLKKFVARILDLLKRIPRSRRSVQPSREDIPLPSFSKCWVHFLNFPVAGAILAYFFTLDPDLLTHLKP